MTKKTHLLFTAFAGLALSAGAQALEPKTTPPVLKGLTCDAPVLTVQARNGVESKFSVACSLPAIVNVVPSVKFSGKLPSESGPPYLARATYLVDLRDETTRRVGGQPRVDQQLSGSYVTSLPSVAVLPAQLQLQTVWDPASQTLSVEERPGAWRIIALKNQNTPDILGLGANEQAADANLTLSDAGWASTPFSDGQAHYKLVLGENMSRFSGKKSEAPVVLAVMGLREGKLELRIGETRVANNSALMEALLHLDKKPNDLTRAWAVAARAQFLGQDDMVRYAEQKVAAHNPDALTEFQVGIRRIKSNSLPN